MVCYSPLKGYRAKYINPETGKRPVVFSASQGYVDKPVIVPCGRCIGCLMTRAFYWSVRCVCESHFHDESYFLTLTYDSKNLPDDRNLKRCDFQSFMKRLRYYFKNYRLKVFYCGEYGERRHRPHFHALIFGLPINKEDIKIYQVDVSRRGNKNFACPFIEKIWGKGRVRLGSFSSGSASYVAQYNLKKHDSKMQKFLKTRDVKPFIGASTRSSIGYEFFMKYHYQIYKRGFFRPFKDSDTICRNLPYFNNLLKKHFPLEYFKFVELPRRRFYSELYSKSYCSGSFGNSLLNRDIDSLRIKEKKVLRALEPRDDF